LHSIFRNAIIAPVANTGSNSIGMNPIARYLKDIEKQLATGRATEHTHRPALQALVDAMRKNAVATNEPTRVACGAPDFIVALDGVTVGYIEAKDIGENLDQVERTAQLARYLEGLPNLILTDYLEFRLYHAGEFVMEARLARIAPEGKLRPNKDGERELNSLFDAFFSAQFPEMATPNDLAARMAATARLLREVIRAALETEADIGELHGQLEAFRRVLLHDLEPAQFADMYAQTICYGLFAARCNHREVRGLFTREAAIYELPETNPFLRQMFGHIAGPSLDKRLSWAVDHLAQLLDRADMGAILRDFGRRTRQEDPVVHFYETFLAAYDSAMREARGVYYTPEPVVSYIVRSVDAILKRDFGIKDGLAATQTVPIYEMHQGKNASTPERRKVGETHQVLILDPAVGTGTFLHGVVDHIHEAVCRKHGKGAWNSYVSAHLLPRLFGFELLMAPYAVAHMKLGIQLAETGYTFQSGERLRVYLTNTLEEAFALGDLPLFASIIAEEANAAGRIKTKYPVMVVLGNPPYSGHSVNKGEWISDLLRGVDKKSNRRTGSYFEVDGEPLRERNPKWLNDDYVKFIRFAQWRIEQTGYGILAFISNHGYLDNPTFRGMRRSLMHTFDDLYLLDLHGNSKKKEKAPDGSKDENVFDIQQGVAIGIFVKYRNQKEKQTTTIRHAELWGEREVWDRGKKGERRLVGGKYAALNSDDVLSTKWMQLTPTSPFYLFIPQDGKRRKEYELGWVVTRIIPVNSVGIVTARDHLSVHWTPEQVWKTVREFSSMLPEEARDRFSLGPDARDWQVTLAQEDIQSSGPTKERIAQVLYRPFDRRWTYYTGRSRGFLCMPRPDVMRHMLAGENLGLSTTRAVEIGRGWEHVFCTRNIIQHHTVSLKEVNYLFPLYLYTDTGEDPQDIEAYAAREEAAAYGIHRKANLSAEFIADISQRLKMTFVPDGTGNLKKTFGPEDVFHYIYAVLHSPTYRARYAEFLKTDFPRIPLASNARLFRELCALGASLVRWHLLEEPPDNGVSFPVSGTNEVDKPEYVEAARRVFINKTQYFDGVAPDIWNFHVGGYPVCRKWLADRKGRVLEFEDIGRYGQIVAALRETIGVMRQIDAAIESEGGWPIR